MDRKIIVKIYREKEGKSTKRNTKVHTLNITGLLLNVLQNQPEAHLIEQPGRPGPL
jgi:hypothetical protein